VFSLVNSAVDVALPAFAAERRAAAPCCGAVTTERPTLSIDTCNSTRNTPHAADVAS